MKRILSTLSILLVCFTVLSLNNSHAQDYVTPPVTISKEKVKMDGKLFYSHVVLEKQTLYSISKAYGVTIDDIYAANPGLKESGLKKNAIILIPVPGNTVSTVDKAGDEVQKTARQERKEAKEQRKKDRKNQKDYFIHTVKWYEDLDVISTKYGVPVDVIMQYNGLQGRKLKNRQQLKIPTNPETYMNGIVQVMEQPAGEKSAPVVKADSSASAVKPVSVNTHDAIAGLLAGSNVNVMLMLPFDAKGSEPSSISMDFYSGVLLAAKDLGDQGINIDLSVYDTYEDALPITVERLAKSDFTIGPPTINGLNGTLAMSPESTYVISPLDSRTASLTDTHVNFIQVPSSSIVQYADLLDWIKTDKTSADNVIIIYEKGIKDLRKETEFKRILDESKLQHSQFSYSIIEGRNILDSLSTLMTTTGVNRVLVASESEAFVNDVVRNLNLLIHNKFKIVLYGASKIRHYETIDVSNLHNTSFHSSLSYYIDYDDPRVKDFLMKYRALFNTEPSQMAFQGYDIMYYFSEMCARYGKKWPDMLYAEDTAMLMSDFRFERDGKGLSRNTVRRIIYRPDYTVDLIRK